MNLPVTQLSSGQFPPENKILWIKLSAGADLYAQTRHFKLYADKESLPLLSVLVEDSCTEVKSFCHHWIYNHLRYADSEFAAAYRLQHNGTVPLSDFGNVGTVILHFRGNKKYVGFYFVPMTKGLVHADAIYIAGSSRFGTVDDTEQYGQTQHPRSRRRPAS